MEFKARSLVVNPEAPFEGDLLGRQHEIENLTLLLRNMDPPMVLAVNGRWGAGKSTFVQMWASHLRRHHYPVLSFNAWTTDFSEDPLVAFLGEMNRNLDDYLKDKGAASDSWERCKKIGGAIARRGLPTLVRLATAGLVDGNELVEDEAMLLMGNAATDAVKAYEETRSAIEDFRSSLSKALEAATEQLPLVVFVDELDRCRPTYAIQLLERIKHLFDQPGIVFVLSLDRDQLCHSIKAVYGEGLDAAGYLRRFIDIEYSLSLPNPEAYVQQLLRSFDLIRYFEGRKQHAKAEHDWDLISGTLVWLCRAFNYTLRDIEQLFSRINLALRATPQSEFMHASLLVFLIVLRDKRQDIYSSVLREEAISVFAMDCFIGVAPRQERIASFHMAVLEGYLLLAVKDPVSNRLEEHKRLLGTDQLSIEEHDYSSTVMSVFNQHGGRRQRYNIDKLLQRIEMVSQFSFPEQETNS